jgi:hypothetical protein
MHFSTPSPPPSNQSAANAFLFQQWSAHPVTDQFIKYLETSITAAQQQVVAGRRQLQHDQLVFLLEAVAARQELLKQIRSGNFQQQ